MKEQHFRYRIVTEWSDEDQSFVGRVPALPGCVAHGNSVAKATREVERAAELMLEVMAEDRRSIPPEDVSADYSGQLRLRLPKSMHERISQLATAEGVSINTLLLSLIAEGAGRHSAKVRGSVKPRASGKRKAVA